MSSTSEEGFMEPSGGFSRADSDVISSKKTSEKELTSDQATETLVAKKLTLLRELVSFGRALEFAGAVGGVILAILPILMLKRARKIGDIVPDWQCNRWITSAPVQGMIIALYSFAALYAVCDLLYNTNLLPASIEEILIGLNVFVPK